MIIYKIENLSNGKKYIGSTKDHEDRKYRHFLLLKNNKHENIYLQRSFNKYGEKSFVFSVICFAVGVSREELYEIENDYVIKLSTKYPRGYNIADPRNAPPCLKGKDHPQYGTHLSDDTKKKIGAAHKGKPSVMKGKKHSEASKEKMRAAKLGRKLSEEHKKNLGESHKGRIPWNKGIKYHNKRTLI